jgi:hypothetical protein
MATSRVSTSSILQGFPKSRSLLIGNPPFIPTDFESIATVTVGSGGSSFVEFTSIPSTYKHLQIRATSRYTGTQNSGAPVYMQFNSDTGSNYSFHRFLGYANLSEVGVAADARANQTYIQLGYTTGGSTTSNMFSVQVTDILQYSNTSINKTVKTLNGYDTNTDTGYRSAGVYSGHWRSTSAITSIKILPDTDSWAQYSSFALYGIKG